MRVTITALATAILLLLAAPPAAEAQPTGKVPRIGYLGMNRPEDLPHLLEALRQGLRDLGRVEGQNIIIEYRWAEGPADRLPALATELVRLNVDVIIAAALQAIQAAQKATKTIPIVVTGTGDPVGDKLAVSLARPGGNITGLTALGGAQIVGKQLQLRKEIVPGVSRFAVLGNPENTYHAFLIKEAEATARSFEVQVRVFQVRNPDQLDQAFAAMRREHAGALLVLGDGMFFGQRARIADLASKSRLAAMYNNAEYVDAGGLMAYEASLLERFRRVATYADKILKGSKPGDLPFEQPSKYALVINMKATKALGLTIPPSLLLRADRVIE